LYVLLLRIILYIERTSSYPNRYNIMSSYTRFVLRIGFIYCFYFDGSWCYPESCALPGIFLQGTLLQKGTYTYIIIVETRDTYRVDTYYYVLRIHVNLNVHYEYPQLHFFSFWRNKIKQFLTKKNTCDTVNGKCHLPSQYIRVIHQAFLPPFFFI